MEDIYPEKINCLLNKKGKICNYIRANWYRDPPLKKNSTLHQIQYQNI
ncbi:hypothetical protein ES705_19448 [subsurface metagenome]